ncbi:MAG: hypothetical protein IPM35_36095 [Myxococcales bacterium]|nr:hypothetical protein [Myxococcales bacterium]
MIRRALTVTLLSWGLVLGCGGDDDGSGGSATGGSGGSAAGGSGGSATGGSGGSATGGSAGTATGGSGGSATGGSAGTATGGSGGSAGTATGGSGGSATGGSGGSGGSTGGSGGSATGGSGGSATGGSGGTATGGTGGTATGGTGGTGGAAACNTVTQLGTAVVETAASGAAPAAQGGTIVAGTYVLTKWEVYSGTPQNLAHQETVKVTPGKAEVVIGSSSPSRANYDFSTAGTTLNATQTCPSGNTGMSFGYTATATELKEFRASLTAKVDVVTYTKQ